MTTNAMPYLGQDLIRSILDINTNAIKEEKVAKEARDRFIPVRNQLRGINGFYWAEEEEEVRTLTHAEDGYYYRWEAQFNGGIDDGPSNLLSTMMEFLLDEDASLFILAYDPDHEDAEGIAEWTIC